MKRYNTKLMCEDEAASILDITKMKKEISKSESRRIMVQEQSAQKTRKGVVK
jgi:hypothetical protein